jgi:hypothetical protein
LLTAVDHDSGGDYWLWLTRPHNPSRCKLASDDPSAGIQILNTLFTALRAQPNRQLRIKPHPNDYDWIYQQLISRNKLGDRVMIDRRPLQIVLPQASVVITEDTTAGMDAMFFRKPMVHVRFSDTAPVLPFVEYGAALPAFDSNELLASVAMVDSRGPNNRCQAMSRFLLDHAGPCDGGAAQRLTELILDVANQP